MWSNRRERPKPSDSIRIRVGGRAPDSDTGPGRPSVTRIRRWRSTLSNTPVMKPGKSRPRRIFRRLLRWALVVFLLYFLPVGYQLATYYFDRERTVPWWNLRRDSSAQAPDPTTTGDAVIQVYAARAVRWRGTLGVHTWIAVKRADEHFYQRVEVMGYALRWGSSSVRIRNGSPDQYWFGNRPLLLREIRGGEAVDRLIDRIHHAARNYPYDRRYTIWPGPNSNTFTAHIGRKIPELSLDLPPTAIGKDYPTDGSLLQTPPGGRGWQFSVGGLFGLLLAPEEGIELNLFGLTAGIDLSPPALKLPGVGRIGYPDLARRTLP